MTALLVSFGRFEFHLFGMSHIVQGIFQQVFNVAGGNTTEFGSDNTGIGQIGLSFSSVTTHPVVVIVDEFHFLDVVFIDPTLGNLGAGGSNTFVEGNRVGRRKEGWLFQRFFLQTFGRRRRRRRRRRRSVLGRLLGRFPTLGGSSSLFGREGSCNTGDFGHGVFQTSLGGDAGGMVAANARVLPSLVVHGSAG